MKICENCGRENNSERKYLCHACYAKEWRSKNRDRFVAYMKAYRERYKPDWKKKIAKIHGPLACAICGYDQYVEILEFHHVDPAQKEDNLCYLMRQKPTKKRLEELQKGIFLCPNCHRLLHYDLISIHNAE